MKCDWFETPQLLADYWIIRVNDPGTPGEIEFDLKRGIVAPCTVNLYGATPIKRIDIYRFEWKAEAMTGTAEAVTYDQAIHFQTEGGKSFCMACQLNGPGIATEIHFSESKEIIQEFLEGSTLRCSIS